MTTQEQPQELTGVIFNIENNYEKSYFPKTGPNAGHELFKHKVTFVDKSWGVFYQITKELMFNKEKCYHGQEICYTSKPSTVEGRPTVLTMCNERDSNSPAVQLAISGGADLSKVDSISFSYSKDIYIAFGNRDLTPEEALVKIKAMSIDIKNFLLGN